VNGDGKIVDMIDKFAKQSGPKIVTSNSGIQQWQESLAQTNKASQVNTFHKNLTIFQLDVTYSVYYITVGSSTCFRCWHPSSGARTTVNAASVID